MPNQDEPSKGEHMKTTSKLLLILLFLMLTETPGFASETSSTILIKGVHIFDGISNKRLMNANLLIEGNLVKKYQKKT